MGVRPKALRTQIQTLCGKLILDARYLKTVQRRLRTGKMPPQMEAVIWYYAFGKPIERIQVEEQRDVRIVHEFVKVDDLRAGSGDSALPGVSTRSPHPMERPPG